MRQLLTFPNIVTMLRVALIPVVAYGLARSDDIGTILCVAAFALAAISDGLDGWLARRMNRVTPLGIALDPIADKLFAGALVILLIIYRDFPLWLAGAIIGRDLAILLLGLILFGRQHKPPAPSLTGKYAFSAIAVLLGSYVIRFEFGVWLLTPIALALLVLSTFGYWLSFVRRMKGHEAKRIFVGPLWKWLRVTITLMLSAWYLWRLYVDLLAG